VRAYRERLLASLDWDPVFPLWGLDTHALARRFVRERFRAIVCCVDITQLAPEWSGREFDSAFLDTLPHGVDPCGERGEFHTCVYDGPIFSRAIALERGERVRREMRFEYCDLQISPRPELRDAG
jgi:diphthamide synthase (EF-2-diphthine--ammonia ligase)